MGGILYENSCEVGRESFTNAFCSNLNKVNLKIFPNQGELYTCRQSPDGSIGL